MRIELQIAQLNTARAEDQADIFAALIESFVDINRRFLRTHSGTPRFYQSGISFRETAVWQDIPSMLATRYGDCKDFVGWRIAELREQGEEAQIHVVFTRASNVLDVFHIQIRRPSGEIEDPTEMLRTEDPRKMPHSTGTPILPPGVFRLR